MNTKPGARRVTAALLIGCLLLPSTLWAQEGQVGAVGHLRIGERAFVAARAGLHHDVPDGARVYGAPATEERAWHRSVAALKRLPDLLRRVRRLERASEDAAGEGPPSEGDSDSD